MSELRICRKAVFGKLVAVVNRNNHIYLYVMTLGFFDTSEFPEVNGLKKYTCQILLCTEIHSDFDVYMTHV